MNDQCRGPLYNFSGSYQKELLHILLTGQCDPNMSEPELMGECAQSTFVNTMNTIYIDL